MRVSTRFRNVLALLPAAALWIAPAVAQDAPPPGGAEPAYGEVVSVHVVNVDVRVTDRDGRPVRGLVAEDFTLREDGEAVDITYFSEVPPRPGAPAAEAPADGASDGETEDDADVPSALLVFVIDDTAVEPRNRQRALEQVRDALDRGFDPYTAVTVAVIDGGLKILAQPTGDVSQLRAALDRIAEAPPQGIVRQRERDAELREVLSDVGGILREVRSGVTEPEEGVRRLNALVQRVQIESGRRRDENLDSLAALGGLVEALQPMPGRKAIVYLSQGLALRPGQAALDAILPALSEITSGGGVAPSSSIDARSAALGALDQQVRVQKRRPDGPAEDLVAVTALAAEAGVSLYAWRATDDLGVAPAELGGDGALGLTASVRGAREDSLTETLDALADGTGGRVALGPGFEGLVEAAVASFGGYYSLGWSPGHGGDRKLHELEVKVQRRGTEVWHPESYIALPPPGSGN
ncbi:MAG: VWA domain-containing protein [Acidobacteriota bacterium]